MIRKLGLLFALIALCGFLPPSHNGTTDSKAAAGGGDTIASVLSSAVMELDVTNTSSYPGSGETWANLIASPADGESQTTYDFWLGVDGDTDGDEPTFTGSAGNAAAYFQTDGADFFQLKASSTTFTHALAKTTGGTDFWMAFVGQIDTDSTANQQGTIFGNHNGSTYVGLHVRHYTEAQGRSLIVLQRGDSAVELVIGTADVSEGGYYFAIVSIDNTNDLVRIWLNTTTAEEAAFVKEATSSDTVYPFQIGGNGSGLSGIFPKGRIVHFSMGNEFIGDTEAGAIIAYLEARHSRDYTP